MEKEKFLKECGITQKDVDEAKCTVEELKKMYYDFKGKCPQYEALGVYIMTILLTRKEPLIHSIKFRVKDPYSLIRKIVDKNKKRIKNKITFENYEEEITDLLWLRILLLDKENWYDIHKLLNCIRKFDEKIAYIPNEKNKIFFYEEIFWTKNVKTKGNLYSSFHYTATIEPTKVDFKFEIQVRSLLEEARSETDHLIRYKNKENIEQNDKILNVLFELLFQKLDSGNALISLLKGYYVDKNPNWLLDKIKKMDIDAEEKKGIINNITKHIENTFILDFYFNDNFTILDQYKDKNFYKSLKDKISENRTSLQKDFSFFIDFDDDKKNIKWKYHKAIKNLRNYINHYQE